MEHSFPETTIGGKGNVCGMILKIFLLYLTNYYHI